MSHSAKEVRRFVKYQNRKLHAVGDVMPYVQMEDIHRLVASGVDIEVTDDLTGKNLTAFTLARLIYDRCRSDHDAFPVKELQQLIMSNPPRGKKFLKIVR